MNNADSEIIGIKDANFAEAQTQGNSTTEIDYCQIQEGGAIFVSFIARQSLALEAGKKLLIIDASA